VPELPWNIDRERERALGEASAYSVALARER
jgi:hypothetical protein